MKTKQTLYTAIFAGAAIAVAMPAWSQANKPSDRVQENAPLGSAARPGATTPPSLPGISDTNRNMGRSDRVGAQTDVRSVQQALKDKGFDPGPVDGMMGPQTRQALRSFQQSKNLKATGRLDADTARQLDLAQR